MNTRPDAFVLYDGECPVCQAYVALAQLKQRHPGLQILDARTQPELVAALRSESYDVNESLIVGIGPTVFAGAAATRLISQLGSSNPILSRAALYAIGGAPWASALYPWLRATRNGLLWVLQRRKIS